MDNINDQLEKLGSIQKVDAPLYMFTAIEAKIRNNKSEWLSPQTSRTIIAAFVLLIIVNTFAIIHVRSIKNEKNIAQVFHLMPDNNLYE